jgi:5-methylphenazine-1-carboxylate 1-monooxygenase
MEILLIGGGIGGLTLALCLHRVGVRSRIFEVTREYKPLGVGINLLPHAVRELSNVGVAAELGARGVQVQDSRFFNSHGQFIYSELCGRAAGHRFPHLTLHRADLHEVLLTAVTNRLGRDAVVMDHRCIGIEQDAQGVTVHFEDSRGRRRASVRGAAAIGCDGVRSAVRRQVHPDEPAPTYTGHTTWRGVARDRPFLSGATVARAGSFKTGLVAAYPIRKFTDGTQLINFVGALPKQTPLPSDWHREGRLADIIGSFRDWRFPWLDIPRLFSRADAVLEYPLFDHEPLDHWTAGRVTLLGDAAHPISPRGGNGAAQAIIDAATLARTLAEIADPAAALRAYEDERRPATTRILYVNRQAPPDIIIARVEQMTGGKPFERLDALIDAREFRAITERYKAITGGDIRVTNSAA